MHLGGSIAQIGLTNIVRLIAARSPSEKSAKKWSKMPNQIKKLKEIDMKVAIYHF